MPNCRVEADEFEHDVNQIKDEELRSQFDNEIDLSEMAESFMQVFPERAKELILKSEFFQTYLNNEFERWKR